MSLSAVLHRSRPRTRRRARLHRTGLVVALVVALAGRQADAATPGFAIDVNQSTALFQLGGLVPGPVGSRCLVLQVSNGIADAAVMSAVVGGTGLAPYLDLVVESGTSANPAVCNDFVGTTVFTGTLAALAAQHPDNVNGLSITLPDQHTTVVRFSVALQDTNAAQGLTAAATFRFDALDTTPTPPPTTQPPTTTTEPPTTVPATDPPTTAVPTTAGRSTTVPPSTTTTTVAPTTTTTVATTTTTTAVDVENQRAKNGAGSRTTIAGGGTGGGEATTTLPEELSPPTSDPEIEVRDPTREAQPASVVERAAEIVTTTVTTAAKTSSVPATFVAMIFFFLVVQDRIDRNDPKLARAPLAPEPELVFQPRSGVHS